MAAHTNQYIFGEFSPDEFNQFFVTPRCYVELPPFNDKVPCVSHNSGEDYQHIEFGVDEVMSSESVAVKDSLYKVSSTLNPQAPEFILGCQPAQKALQAAAPIGSVSHNADFNSVDCADSEPLALDSQQACSDIDGVSSGLGQRERKKKKKRPPGYYNYLEGSDGGGTVDGVTGTGLVNGHALSTSALMSEDMGNEVLPDTDLTPSTLASTPSTAHSAPPANQRTCDSPDESSLDLTSGAASLSECNAASSSSSSSSQSGALADRARTAEQHTEPSALESPELQGSGGNSPCPTSPPPPRSTAVVIAASATTDEDVHQANGISEPVSANRLKLADVQSDTALAPHSSDSDVQAPSLVPATASVPNAPKSWASLFHKSKPLPGGPQAYVEVKAAPVTVPVAAPASELPEKACDVRESPVPVSEDPMAPKLAELIENVKLIHKPVSLQPRGLVNKGNWCYINAILQALIACPPMYHLMKSIPIFNETHRPCTSTPMMDNFVRLVNEFSNMPVPSKAKQQAAGEKTTKDVRPGAPFEPTYIYKLLTLIKSSMSEKGRQEDAEEYLGFTLNGLHEEMLALKKLISPPEETEVSTPNGPGSHVPPEDPANKDEENEEGSDDEWEQVGPRNKTSITRQADFIRTPITDIFGGHIRSVVYQQSSKESATLQPFFTLQLDIQSEKIRTVQEALETMVARESVQGYTTKTKQEIEISRRVTLEELPPVLVLHLKRFVFEKTGGCQKLIKNVDYPVDLEISKDLLSPGVRSKTLKGQRTYRLFAVVYHHGNSATGGHYTTDVFHIGLNGWLRIDDQAVKVINQFHVMKQTAERTAYLLYYRRVDLM
ncbi:ubiquitin carboxyl-terminal hydrolase 10 isoform X2 [Trichomycterus rosablanca]|uniref:ubiquitin carboxyl-terminal hydrolase 10 isoform X2 n=1 Tax=Trichomycterus rosablanca TaxID=2290929 RepID=UPI002F35BF1C